MLELMALLWSLICAVATILLVSKCHPIVALPFLASALLAIRFSWGVLARWGFKAGRPVKVVAIVGTYALGSILMAQFAPLDTLIPKVETTTAPSMTVAADPAVTEDPPECTSGKSKPVDFAVQTAAPLRTHRSEQAAQVSIPFGTDKVMTPVAIDPTMPVRQLCHSATWSKVRILQLPSDIGKAEGWVPTSVLRPVKTDNGGRRVYEAGDFEWPEGSKRYEKAFLTVINRIMKQNSKCDAFGPQALLVGKNQAGALLTVSCFGADEQTIEFRPEDATNNRSFAPVEPVRPIAENDAYAICEEAIKQSATHPSTLDISRWSAGFQAYTDGRSAVQMKFSAKNAFNLELKYVAHCAFKGGEFLNIDINETAD